MTTSKEIELLAPARDAEVARAAVDFGADAIYMGAPKFGARRDAGNSVEDIARAVDYARRFGVRVYATLNTLLFEDELPQAESIAREVVAAGVDALIIQDMAYMEMGIEGVEFHASTQTFNATPEKVRFLQQAGFARVILERGLTIDEIRAIRAATDVELECFVHGAVCVCHSGRCYMSRATSARSGNRGDCSQPCRMAYDLVGGDGRRLTTSKHLLSVRDLDYSASIGELLDAGVTSFKIEGRLKDADYVRNVVAWYRRALDEAMRSRDALRRASVGESAYDFEPDPARTFTRAASDYFLHGKRRGVGTPDTPKAMGAPLGRVARTGADWFELDGDVVLSPGDGLCFLSGGALTGSNVNSIQGRRVFPNRMEPLSVGDEVFRNYDHKFLSALARSRTTRRVETTVRVEITTGVMASGTASGAVKGAAGAAESTVGTTDAATNTATITVTYTDPDGISAGAAARLPGGDARDTEKMAQTIVEQVSRSGDTIFKVGGVEVFVDGAGWILGVDVWTPGAAGEPSRVSAGKLAPRTERPIPFIPVSMLSSLRRQALDALLRERTTAPRRKAKADCEATMAGAEACPNPLSGSIPAVVATKATGIGVGAVLTAEDNITNSLARRFYERYGFVVGSPGHDLVGDLTGKRVMRSPYCIRREIGECLKQGSALRGELTLEHGTHRYPLAFDCDECMMDVYFER